MDGNIISNLIEFALQNIWVVVIVVGFLFNVVKRFNGNVAEPTTPIPVPDPFKQFQQEERSETLPQEKKYEEIAVEPIKAEPVIERTNHIYEQYLQAQEKITNIPPTSFEEKPIVRKRRNGFSSNKVVEGVIWSEILGPPRAKRPYSRR